MQVQVTNLQIFNRKVGIRSLSHGVSVFNVMVTIDDPYGAFFCWFCVLLYELVLGDCLVGRLPCFVVELLSSRHK